MTELQVLTSSIQFLCIFICLIGVSKKLNRIEDKINNKNH